MPKDALIPQAPAEDAVYRKIAWRILPLLLICYFFSFLDRTNIGFAKLQMMGDLGFNEAAYGFGAGIFFLGYVMCEIPSNIVLSRIGARKTLGRIMLLWGITSSAMIFVNSESAFYSMRFLLGVFEAGFAPGVIFFLASWFPVSRMAVAMSLFLFGAPVSGIIGGPLSGWIMSSLHDAFGLAGWQWLFLVEGIPSIILAGVVFFVLDDSPAHAKWLTVEEKTAVTSAVRLELSHNSIFEVLKDQRVWLFGIIAFCISSGLYTSSFWLPTMLRAAGVVDLVQIGIYTAVPNALGAIAAILVARRSDRLGERKWHTVVPLLLSGVSLGVAARCQADFDVFFPAMCLSTGCIWTANSLFWSVPTMYFHGKSAAPAFALINSISLLGAFVSPTVIGWAKNSLGTIDAGLYVMVCLVLIGSALAAACVTRRANKLELGRLNV